MNTKLITKVLSHARVSEECREELRYGRRLRVSVVHFQDQSAGFDSQTFDPPKNR